MLPVVKRRGHIERFDRKKVYASIYAACASYHLEEKSCENIAEKTSKKLDEKIKNKKEIKASEIHALVLSELKKINSELAFFYDKHLPNLKKL